MKFLIVLLALFAVVFAQQPHKDTTVVVVGEAVDATSEHFLISVDHIEDVFDANGVVVAERDIRVAVRFDVSEATYTVNDVPVQVGYSELQVMAQVVEVLAEGEQRPFDELVQLSLRVFVALRKVQLEDGTEVEGVIMQERVIGIQSNEVWQADVVEQSFIFRKDGTVHRQGAVQIAILQGEPAPHAAPVSNEEAEKQDDTPAHPVDGKKPHDWFNMEHEKEQIEGEVKEAWGQVVEFANRAAAWFHTLPFYQRVLVAFGGGIVLALVFILISKILRCICCCGKKNKACSGCKCPFTKATPAPAPATGNYKDNIRVYSLQYTAVPQDEKDGKKKEAGSIEMV